jgi:hypothetical protein
MNMMILLKHYKMEGIFTGGGIPFTCYTIVQKTTLCNTCEVVKQGTPYLGQVQEVLFVFKHAKHQ